MKISVVTISFNQVQFLRECMESVLSQKSNLFDLEYIVVDPGSTDGSRELIEEYGDSVVRVFEPDNGPADGLNKGFARATGDVFAFLNSDDIFISGAFEQMRNTMSTTHFDVVSGEGYVIDRDGNHVRRLVPSRFTPWLYAYGAVTLFQQGTFFRADIFRKIGGFNTKNRTCWDGELFLDMAIAGARFGSITAEIAKFRIYDESITGSNRLADAYKMDMDRLFQNAMQRKMNKWDVVISYLARGIKIAFNPTYTIRRILAN